MTYKQGDTIKLGDHILICGDSTTVQIPEVKIRMVCTDPPYGVAYVENKDFVKLGKCDVKPIANDHLQSEDEYKRFTKGWIEPILGNMDSYNTVYIFHADSMTCSIRSALKEVNIYYSQTVIWVKNAVVIGRKDYLPQHELIAYGWYGKHKTERSKAKSIIFHPKPAKAKLHPTMKPVGLLRQLILQSTRKGEWVYDPFGGSGSTLIACEHTMRKCLMVEMEPEYVNTIVARWEKLTGKKATLWENKQ